MARARWVSRSTLATHPPYNQLLTYLSPLVATGHSALRPCSA